MSNDDKNSGLNRRGALECMAWAGGGLLWSLGGGVPKVAGFLGAQPAHARRSPRPSLSPRSPTAISALTNRPTRSVRDFRGSDRQNRRRAGKPAFMIHTGDISHLAKPSQFDDAEKIISAARLDVHYVPGEHDLIDEGSKAYLERYGKNTVGRGWYSFDQEGVHFIGLVNAINTVDGIGHLGADQLEWLTADLKVARRRCRSWSSHISPCGLSIRIGDGQPMTA